MAQRQFRTDDTSLWVDRYGNGSDGALTVSGSTTFSAANTSPTGNISAGATSIVVNSGTGFADGNIVLIHQTRGTGAGNWELNKIASGGTGTSWTMAYETVNAYNEDGGANQTQIMLVKQYTTVDIQNGVTLTGTAWDGGNNGIVVYLAMQSITVTGTITTVGKGFRNNALTGGSAQGEGSAGAPSYSTAANGNGGGGGGAATDGGHVEGGNSGGGGSISAGTNGSTRNTGTGGTGGSAVGSSSLVTFTMGGASGYGGNNWSQSNAHAGVNGSGAVILIAPEVTITGTINCNGQNGTSANDRAATGGSGAGVCLIKGQRVALGSNCTANGGTGGTCTAAFGGTGGNGGNGIFHVDYSQTLTGSTSPTVNSSVDAILNDLPRQESYSMFL